ncbi:neuropeptide-like protein C4orf48 homolog [Rhinatrema bivittatum]|uniref:neuropeptide-like protein C4orf48 homolog n=1 Tax=Rhinatrema bivittatum TaxID=194408 RepID=UPI001126F895|nr:neuropeptide-like protein C4orf48 homolog [Rhinatrema bivittatum]
MLRAAALLPASSGHFKEISTEPRERASEREIRYPAKALSVVTGKEQLIISTTDLLRQKPQRLPKRLHERDLFHRMALLCHWRRTYFMLLLVLVTGLLCMESAAADQESGTTIPAESRPCVDCHAFEFMQRALQDLKKTAYNLDSRTETLLLQVEKRTLCDCTTVNALS